MMGEIFIMPIYRAKNELFFRTWTPEMAYVLGFFAADGSMYRTRRGSCYIEFQITDGELLQAIRGLLLSENKISALKTSYSKKTLYRLQIGSKIIFDDLSVLGMTPRKSKTLQMPHIPNAYFPHFLRGYFDGDGNVSVFKKRNAMNVLTRFTSGSPVFLADLACILKKFFIVGSLYPNNGNWQLSYAKESSYRLFLLMYGGGTNHLIYLRRKYIIFHDVFSEDAAVVQPG